VFCQVRLFGDAPERNTVMDAQDKLALKIYCSDPDKLAQGFLLGYILKHWQGGFYLWDAGRYIRLSDDEMRLRVKQFLHNLNQFPDAEQIKISTHLVANILLCAAGMSRVFLPGTRTLNSWPDGRERLGIQTFVFNNTTVMLDSKQGSPVQIPHTPDYFTTIRLPYDYDPEASYSPWEDFLLSVMEGDEERVILLQQWAGYLLMPTLRQQKYLLIAGEGSNGKGVYVETTERMLGRENVTHIPLAEFGLRFALASSLGKLANMSSESGADITAYGENVLKSYTAGDAMSFSRKYLDPIECVPTAKVMISTNELPKIQDRTQGIWRRLIFVPFERTYSEKEQDKHLADKLAMHLSGIFNWAVRGIGLLNEHAGFATPAKCVEALEDYQLRMNPARGFLQENYELNHQAEGVLCGGIYRDYTAWSESNGFRPLNSANFGREVKRTYPGVAKVKKTVGDRQLAIYTGLQKVDSQSAFASAECVKTAFSTDSIANPFL
jgi:P4 family phage/plasmid primase-like protien